MTDKCTPQLYDKSPPAAIKKAIRKRISADAFSAAGFAVMACLLVPPAWVWRFKFRIVQLRIGLRYSFIVCAIAFWPVFRRELVCGGA